MTTKKYSTDFVDYMEFVVNNAAYTGLPYIRKTNGAIVWLAPKVSDIGKSRIVWAARKAHELGINSAQNGWLSKVMYEIHPTKQKPCQICGKTMSISYLYLNKTLIAALTKSFTFTDGFLTETTPIDEVMNFLLDSYPQRTVLSFFVKRMNLKHNAEMDRFIQQTFGIDLKQDFPNVEQLIEILEKVSRAGFTKSLLGPGAMSNFPDRYDGYHSYNRCCRKKEDSGRHEDNMRTYNKDRRAYEYWSDGNIRAANQYMKSIEFKGMSADHIGPISLGFKHDNLFFRKMTTGDNSAKRDRLEREDIQHLIRREKQYGVSAASLHTEEVWKYIKKHYQELPMEEVREVMKLNLHLYLELLFIVKQNGGSQFLHDMILEPKLHEFEYNYTLKENGEVNYQVRRSLSDTFVKEIDRFERVSFSSLDEYHAKANRRLQSVLLRYEEKNIQHLLEVIAVNRFEEAYQILRHINLSLQNTLIQRLKPHEG